MSSVRAANAGDGTIIVSRQDTRTCRWHTFRLGADDARELADALHDALARPRATSPAKARLVRYRSAPHADTVRIPPNAKPVRVPPRWAGQ